MRRCLPVAGWVVAILFSQDALAHHAYAEFDVNRELTLRGIAKTFQWTSPHVWIDLMIRDPSGKESHWLVEAASPLVLHQFGWSRNSIKPGDHIRMVIHPRKDGAPSGSLVSAIVNGQVVGGMIRPA